MFRIFFMYFRHSFFLSPCFMCVCMCLFLYVCGICAFACGTSKVDVWTHPPPPPLSSIRWGLSIKPSTNTWLVLLAHRLWGSSLSLLRIELQASHHSSVPMGSGGLNPGLHTCMVSFLVAEPSSQFWGHLKNVIYPQNILK